MEISESKLKELKDKAESNQELYTSMTQLNLKLEAQVKELKDVIGQLEGANDDMVRRGNKRHAELQKYKQFVDDVNEWADNLSSESLKAEIKYLIEGLK